MLAVARASCSPAGSPRLFACAISVGDIRTRCRRQRRHRPRRRGMYALSAIEIRRRCRLRRRGVNVTRNELGCITRGDRELKADSCRRTFAEGESQDHRQLDPHVGITSGILSLLLVSSTSPAFTYELSR